MSKKIAIILFKALHYLDKIFYLIFKRHFIFWFSDLISQNLYQEKMINNKKFNFFMPNHIIKWRVDTFFSKEPDTIKWIQDFENKNKIIFWDIGANIGLFSIYAAAIHENISVISFEPSTSNLRILSRNLSINKLNDKITIHQLPLTDKKNQHLIMNESEFIEGWSMNTFGSNIDYKGNSFKPKQSYKIFGTNVDTLVQQKILQEPQYLKIDVDGIEHKILSGAINLLNKDSVKSILIELNENYKDQYNSVIKMMKNCNFYVKSKIPVDLSKNRDKFNYLFNYVFEKNESKNIR